MTSASHQDTPPEERGKTHLENDAVSAFARAEAADRALLGVRRLDIATSASRRDG